MSNIIKLGRYTINLDLVLHTEEAVIEQKGKPDQRTLIVCQVLMPKPLYIYEPELIDAYYSFLTKPTEAPLTGIQ